MLIVIKELVWWRMCAGPGRRLRAGDGGALRDGPAAWTRLLGHCDDEDLREADPDTLRYRIWHIPARLASHARQRTLKISPDWPWKNAFLTCWQRLCALPAPA